MNNFRCGDYNYIAGRMDARKQFHIVRRLAPFLSGLMPSFAKLEGKKISEVGNEELMSVLPGVADALASMDDDTADYVIFGLLGFAKREQGQGLGWAPVSNGNSLMFQDIDMPQMLTIAGRVLMANLGSFFAVLKSASSQLGQTPNGQ